MVKFHLFLLMFLMLVVIYQLLVTRNLYKYNIQYHSMFTLLLHIQYMYCHYKYKYLIRLVVKFTVYRS